MPRVPTYDSFQVGQTAMPQTRMEGGMSQEMAAMPARQAQQVDSAIMGLGDKMAHIEMDIQQEANQLRVDDALNQAKERAMTLQFDQQNGFQSLRGIDALDRKSGKPLADEYGEELQNQMSQISDTLGNDYQRKMFNMRANDLMTQFRGSALQHEAQQFREYSVSVREGTIKNRQNSIALNYNNPAAIDEDVKSIQAATFDLARTLGKSAEWAEAEMRKATSNAHMIAIGAAVQNNDIAYADGYLRKYSKQMDADDLLKVQGLITKEMDNRVGMSAATAVMQGASAKMNTSEGARAWNILIGAESGGKHFAEDGVTPLTSPKGAVGVAQVMPATGPEAAKLAGLEWDKEKFANDPKYNEALGRAYFGKQLQNYGGDLAKAYAAYNAGPGALDKAIKTAEKEQNANWLQYLPQETQKYVTNNVNAYQSGQGKYQKPTLQDIHNELRADPALANNPSRLKIAIDESTRQYEEQTKAMKERDDQAVATAMQQVIANGGRYSDLPVSVRSAIPPKEVDNVMNFAQRVAKGNDVTSPGLYQKLSNDEYLKSLGDNEFYKLRSELSDQDFKQFAKEREKLRTGKAGSGADDLNTEAMNSVLNDRLRILGIDPTPKDGSNDAAYVGAVRRFVKMSMLSAQQDNGKKFTDAEVSNHIDALFAKNQTFRNSFAGFNTGTTSQPLLSMRPGDVPGDIKDKIKADLKAMGNSNPTDAEILGHYWIQKFKK